MRIHDLTENESNVDGFEEAKKYITKKYPFGKTYLAKRLIPQGFYLRTDGESSNDRIAAQFPDEKGRIIDDPMMAKYNKAQLDKSEIQIDAMKAGLRLHKLTPILRYSGDEQVTRSIGYSWITYENLELGVGILSYMDRGGGSDEIMIRAEDQDTLSQVVKNFMQAGIIADPNLAKQEAAEKRLATINKRGFKVGTVFERNGNSYEIVDIAKNGMLKIKDQSGSVTTSKPGLWQASWIKK